MFSTRDIDVLRYNLHDGGGGDSERLSEIVFHMALGASPVLRPCMHPACVGFVVLCVAVHRVWGSVICVADDPR